MMPTGEKRGLIRALKKQEKAYRNVLKEVVDAPILSGFASGLAVGGELAVAIELGTIEAQSQLLRYLADDGTAKIEGAFVKLSEQHRQTFIKKFTSLVAVDVTPLLNAGPIAAELSKFTVDNVNLIRLIGKNHLPKVAKQVEQALKDQPFSRAKTADLFRKQWNYSDYPLRRIARDQTSKAVSSFNQIRQQQVGVEEYEWLAVGDNRTRPTHMDNSGQVFRWDQPPASTGHPGNEIQCFVENTFVYPAGLSGICAYEYIGKVIKIRTELTEKNPLTVTENHPIKLVSGEKPARELVIGDVALISHRSVFDKVWSQIYRRVESIWEDYSKQWQVFDAPRDADLYISPSSTLEMLPLANDFRSQCSRNVHALQLDQFKEAQITGLDVEDYCGTVYSLESDTGSLIAEGLLVSNCRCVALPILPKLI